MTRKDNEKEERPHYYSQFWLDIAAGRREIGAPKSGEGTELAESETPESLISRKSGRSAAAVNDGYSDGHSHTMVELPSAHEEAIAPDLEPDEFGLTDEVDDLDLPDNFVEDTLDEAAEEADVADMDADLTPAEDEEEDFFDEEEEEEEDDDWPLGRGRKKAKPGRQAKPPKSLKKPRREPRRGF